MKPRKLQFQNGEKTPFQLETDTEILYIYTDCLLVNIMKQGKGTVLNDYQLQELKDVFMQLLQKHIPHRQRK